MSTDTQVITAESSRKTARIFYYGNILAGLLPVPFFALWFGGSILAYAMLRHHPNSRVGYYTQIGAYNYYALAGMFVVLLTFAPWDFFINWWWAVWIFSALTLVPFSIMQILKINRESWQDVKIEK